jgi:hypothetical protein
MPPFLLLLSSILAALLAGAAVLHLIPKLGARSLSAALCRAPGLDIVITYFTAALSTALCWRGIAGPRISREGRSAPPRSTPGLRGCERQ